MYGREEFSRRFFNKLGTYRMSVTVINLLQLIHGSDPVAAAILDHLAGRRRVGKKMAIENAIRIARKAGINGSYAKLRRALVDLFKTFATLNLGEFRHGRGGKPTRIIWRYSSREIGRAGCKTSSTRPATKSPGTVRSACDGGGEAAAEQTSFSVVLTGVRGLRIPVVRVIRDWTGLSLLDSLALVKKAADGAAVVREGVDNEEAEKMKSEIEEAGGEVELK
jgi:large subunit ribosomal protein L7/L12